MSEFQSDLLVVVLAPAALKAAGVNRQRYRLLTELSYQSELLKRVVRVPGAFETDFASIPRIAWRYLDPEDPAILYPSVIHDYLYSLRGQMDDFAFTREDADGVLREAMAACGARWDQQKVAYRAVRLFGGSHWKE